MTKKFAVCGDSFAAALTEKPVAGQIWHENEGLEGTHYSEILCNRLGYTPLHLARGAMSNGGIRLQVETAIEQNVDFIYAITTGSDRLEFRGAGADNQPFNWRKASTEITYSYHGDVSCLSPDLGNNTIHSETINNILENTYTDPNAPTLEQKDALQQYFVHLHEPDLKHRQDSWIFSSLVTLLRRSNIPFLLVDVSNFCLYPDIEVDYDNRVVNGSKVHQLNPRHYLDDHSGPTARYHTSPETQTRIAWYTEEYITKENLLDV